MAEKLFKSKDNQTIGSDNINKNKNVKTSEPRLNTSKDKVMIEELTQNSTAGQSDVKKEEIDLNTCKDGEKTNAYCCNAKNDNQSNVKIKEEKEVIDELPPWLPKLKDGLTVIQPLQKPIRQHKKVRLFKYFIY